MAQKSTRVLIAHWKMAQISLVDKRVVEAQVWDLVRRPRRFAHGFSDQLQIQSGTLSGVLAGLHLVRAKASMSLAGTLSGVFTANR